MWHNFSFLPSSNHAQRPWSFSPDWMEVFLNKTYSHTHKPLTSLTLCERKLLLTDGLPPPHPGGFPVSWYGSLIHPSVQVWIESNPLVVFELCWNYATVNMKYCDKSLSVSVLTFNYWSQVYVKCSDNMIYCLLRHFSHFPTVSRYPMGIVFS